MKSAIESPASLIRTVTGILNKPCASVEECLGGVAQHLIRNLTHRARVTIWIKAQPSGLAAAHVTAGEPVDSPAVARLVFSRPLEVRGVNFGHLQVDLFEMQGSPGVLLTVLEVIAIQTALRAEHWRLEKTRARLKHQITTEKVVARASGLLSRDRGMSVATARQWLQDEAARSSRPLRWIAEMLLTGRRLFGPQAAA